MSAILLDTCVWGGTLSALIELGHDTVWTGSWDQDPGDRIILEKSSASK
jgi:PIN domain nuclease of toxin-antitoxin system